MSLRIHLRLRSFLFERERMWKVRINHDGPDWHIRRLTQQEAVAQAAGNQFINFTDFRITKIGPDQFNIEAKVGKHVRGLGVASCIPA